MLALAFAFLTLSALSLWLAPAALGPEPFDALRSASHLLILAVWGAGAWLVHRQAGAARPNRDPLLLPVGMLMVGWGMLVVWRISPSLGLRQVAWFALGMLLLTVILRGPPDLRWIRRYKYLWLSAGILLTGLTLLFGTHPSGGEPELWLGCCGIYLQPSEPLRLLLLAFVASYLAERILAGWADITRPSRAAILPLLGAWGIAALLLAAQRDLGMATLFLLLLALMAFVATGRRIMLLLGGALALLGGALGGAAIDVVGARFSAWLNPWADPTGLGYQVVQSLIAIASGGLLGAGPGLGAPSLVPVVQSDFVFAAVVEEWGMLGGLALIGLFAVLVARGLRIAVRSREPFTVLLAAGVSVALGSQALIILGGVMRLLPITGVTLPFVSYGGSSLVTSLIALSLLLVLSREGTEQRGDFSPQIYDLQRLFTAGWVLVAAALGWWVLHRGDTLQARTDNQRRALVSQYARRGSILDRTDRPLARSEGQRGQLRRVYLLPEAANSVGYDTAGFGQSGIEQSMDAYLRGEAGHDAFQVAWSKLLSGAPPAGYQVRLTLDSELQLTAAAALEGSPGALVALDPNSGDILAMASYPSYDPNWLAQDWQDLIQREDAPLLNRPAQGRYQPGMSIAPFLYAWTIEQGLRIPGQAVDSLRQTVTLEGEPIGCLFGAPMGQPNTLETALSWGCPFPFADQGELLGAEGLEQMLSAFGLDLPIDIRLATAATLPPEIPSDSESLRQAAIGQGDLLVTPLHIARAFSALAAGGLRPALSVVDAVSPASGPWQQIPALEMERAALSPRTAQTTLEAMGARGDGRIDYTAVALSGPENAKVSWYMGARLVRGQRLVVVVVLEQGSVQLAERLGRMILDAR